jgi:hypothetical protein
LAKMDSAREMKLVYDARPVWGEYFGARQKIEISKCLRFQGITGWERPTSDTSRDNSSGRTGRRWTRPSGTVANPIITAEERKLASICTMQNWGTIRALIYGILCAKWAKNLHNVSDHICIILFHIFLDIFCPIKYFKNNLQVNNFLSKNNARRLVISYRNQ